MPEEISSTVETPQPTKEKSFDWVKVILAIITGLIPLAAAAYGGYWYGTESAKVKTQTSKPQLKTQNQQAAQPTTKPTSKPAPDLTEPTDQVDETGNWKVYKDSANGIEFRYPQDWGTLLTGENNQVLMVAPEENIKTEVNLKKENKPIGYSGKLHVLTIEKLSQAPSIRTDGVWQVRQEAAIVAGKPATKYVSVNLSGDPPGYSKGDQIINLVIARSDGYLKISLLDSKYKNTFNQILSTFKFLD